MSSSYLGATGQTVLSSYFSISLAICFSFGCCLGRLQTDHKGNEGMLETVCTGRRGAQRDGGHGDEEEVKQSGLDCRRDGSACTNHGASTQ